MTSAGVYVDFDWKKKVLTANQLRLSPSRSKDFWGLYDDMSFNDLWSDLSGHIVQYLKLE